MDVAGVRAGRRLPLAARPAAMAAVLIGAALLTAACGAAARRTPPSRPQRRRGVHHDPTERRRFPQPPHFRPAGLHRPELRLPREGKPELNPVLQAQVNRANLAFARCMRRHGIAKFADSWGGGISIGRMQRLGIDTNSPRFSAALKACGF